MIDGLRTVSVPKNKSCSPRGVAMRTSCVTWSYYPKLACFDSFQTLYIGDAVNCLHKGGMLVHLESDRVEFGAGTL